MKPLTLSVLVLLLCTLRVVTAADEMLNFESPAQRELFTELTHEYRCLKCQNQTIASSAAGLAGDLRREIHTMVLAGRSRAEIDDYLLQRYGDFVLYKPRFKSTTLLLWLGPFTLLLLALWFALKTARTAKPDSNADPQQLDRARDLLNKS